MRHNTRAGLGIRRRPEEIQTKAMTEDSVQQAGLTAITEIGLGFIGPWRGPKRVHSCREVLNLSDMPAAHGCRHPDELILNLNGGSTMEQSVSHL